MYDFTIGVEILNDRLTIRETGSTTGTTGDHPLLASRQRNTDADKGSSAYLTVATPLLYMDIIEPRSSVKNKTEMPTRMPKSKRP